MTPEEHRHIMEGVEDVIVVLLHLYLTLALMLLVVMIARTMATLGV